MNWTQDLRFAFRMIRKNPWFSAAIVVTLARPELRAVADAASDASQYGRQAAEMAGARAVPARSVFDVG